MRYWNLYQSGLGMTSFTRVLHKNMIQSYSNNQYPSKVYVKQCQPIAKPAMTEITPDECKIAILTPVMTPNTLKRNLCYATSGGGLNPSPPRTLNGLPLSPTPWNSVSISLQCRKNASLFTSATPKLIIACTILVSKWLHSHLDHAEAFNNDP